MPTIPLAELQQLKNLHPQRCPYCGSAAGIVWVHGHGQCNNCKINVDECCRGEEAACQADTTYSTSETK